MMILLMSSREPQRVAGNGPTYSLRDRNASRRVPGDSHVEAMADVASNVICMLQASRS